MRVRFGLETTELELRRIEGVKCTVRQVLRFTLKSLSVCLLLEQPRACIATECSQEAIKVRVPSLCVDRLGETIHERIDRGRPVERFNCLRCGIRLTDEDRIAA